MMTAKPAWAKWISALGTVAIASNIGFAQTSFAQEEGAAELGDLRITGSRLKQLDVEGPSPVVVITRGEMEERGFATVYEALENLTQNTGALQGEQYTNSFTPNAQDLSLRNLGGGRTLVLLNGRRVADYPQPFNSQSNFFNFATIPMTMVERVEVLTGGASAVYGSDAVAGVINIILRDDVVAPTLTARVGTTYEGGGDSRFLSFVWGKQWNRFSVTVGAEYQDMDPIYGKDRSYLDSVDDAPQVAGKVPFTRSALTLSNWYDAPEPASWTGPDAYPGIYYDPPQGAATCENLESQDVPYVYAFREGRGNYCGRDDFGDETLQSKRERASVYLNATWDITDSTSMYGNLLYWDSSAELQGFHNWWGTDVWDPNIISSTGQPGDWTYIQRVFHPNETGAQVNTFDESAATGVVGVQGSFSNFWNWDVGLSYSTNDYSERQSRFKEEVADAYFGGDQMINICPELGFGCVLMQPDVSTAQFNIYDPLSQADIDAVMGRMAIDSDASVWTIDAQLDGDLMEMRAGPLQFAAIVEYASQEYQITPDSRLLDQTGAGWWGLSGTGGGGERDRYAAGIEFGIPLHETFQATIAARYDQYNDNSDVGGAPTWGMGLEYRPVDSLMLRGSYNTSFRAPDMHYLFADQSGFFQTSRDIYQCRTDAADAGVEYNELDCDDVTVAGERQGSLALVEETGDSMTLGFVWNPLNELSLTFDYYEIEIKDAVTDMSTLQMLRDEADCQIGETPSGAPVDQNSAFCTDVLARVTRETTVDPTEISDVDTVNVDPINSSVRQQRGYDVTFDYAHETQNVGMFRFRVDYTHVLEDKRQVYSYDPIEDDFRDDLTNFNARSVVNTTIGWDVQDFSTVLYAHRLGSMPNWAETGRLPTWTTYNMSATLRFFEDKLAVSAIVQNILDERPPYDDGFDTWPFFFRGQYNALGREMFLQARYVFE